MATLRLNKFIAQSGISSRRKADELILSGLIQVNGKTIKTLGLKVDPHTDQIRVNGKVISAMASKIYVLFHKPKFVLSTLTPTDERKTCLDYLEHLDARLFPLEKLDWNSEGLMILTNDAELATKFEKRMDEVERTYMIKLEGQPDPEKFNKLKTGVSTSEGKVKLREIARIKKPDTKHSWLKVTSSALNFVQINQAFAKIGHNVLKLQLVSLGDLQLGSLDRGDSKFLELKQLDKIFKNRENKVKKKRKVSSKRAGIIP